MDLLNASTQMHPPDIMSFTEGESLDSLPTQADGGDLAEWRCSGVTQQTDDHPTEIDIAHPTLTPLGSNPDASRMKKDLTEGGRPPIVDTL